MQPSDGGAVSDEVLLDGAPKVANRIPTSGDVVFDPRSKAAFRVLGGKLKRLSLPMLGGFGSLTASGQSLEAWSPTAWRAIDVSLPAKPTWLEPGGPVLGRVRAFGIDVGMTTLLDDPGFNDQYAPPTPRSAYAGILGFDGFSGSLSERNALRPFTFDSTSEQLALASTIRCSHYPLAVTAVAGVLAVASNHDVVLLSPRCSGP